MNGFYLEIISKTGKMINVEFFWEIKVIITVIESNTTWLYCEISGLSQSMQIFILGLVNLRKIWKAVYKLIVKTLESVHFRPLLVTCYFWDFVVILCVTLLRYSMIYFNYSLLTSQPYFYHLCWAELSFF